MSLPEWTESDMIHDPTRPWWAMGYILWQRSWWSIHLPVPAKAAHRRRYGR